MPAFRASAPPKNSCFSKNEGFKYHPDVVVLGFFANDFEDNLKAGLFELDDQSRLVELKHEHIPGVRIQNLHLRDPVGQVAERELVLLLAAVQRRVELLQGKAAERALATGCGDWWPAA